LIEANSEEDAKHEGLRIGKQAEHEYAVIGDTVKWTFIQNERVYQIEDEKLKNGKELFLKFLHDSEVKSILTPFED
jgi:hypothetical protein